VKHKRQASAAASGISVTGDAKDFEANSAQYGLFATVRLVREKYFNGLKPRLHQRNRLRGNKLR